MAGSKATTPESYIAELPPERAALVSHVRKLVNDALPDGFVERMSYGMIGWEVPRERYPDTYNGQPLGYVGLAAQKNHVALYLYGVYGSPERTKQLADDYAAAGKALDMGKSCIRFKRADQLAEDALARTIASLSVEEFIAACEASRAS